MLDTVGWVLVKQGKFQEASPYMTSSYAISPRSIIVLHLALIEAAIGKTEDALRLYAIARQMPGFVSSDAAELRKQLEKQLGDGLARGPHTPGLVPSAPGQNLPEGTFLALVSGDGTVQDASVAALKSLKLLPISWSDHSLRSVRTIKIHNRAGSLQVTSYIGPPPIQ
ncbi:MAG: hypothetical protein WB992_01110 [Bryobacteraceae bacterium]